MRSVVSFVGMRILARFMLARGAGGAARGAQAGA
jgi:hypothetical protein